MSCPYCWLDYPHEHVAGGGIVFLTTTETWTENEPVTTVVIRPPDGWKPGRLYRSVKYRKARHASR